MRFSNHGQFRALVELRGTTTTLAVSVRSGSLLNRIRRLFGRDPAERSVGAGVVGVGLLALAYGHTQADHDFSHLFQR